MQSRWDSAVRRWWRSWLRVRRLEEQRASRLPPLERCRRRVPLRREQSSPFSVNAADAASSAYAAYRALNGQILIQPVGNVTHAFSDANGTLSVSELQTSAVRELANDVTLSGAEEPAAYIEENFFGDGTTTVFNLSEPGISRYQPDAGIG